MRSGAAWGEKHTAATTLSDLMAARQSFTLRGRLSTDEGPLKHTRDVLEWYGRGRRLPISTVQSFLPIA